MVHIPKQEHHSVTFFLPAHPAWVYERVIVGRVLVSPEQEVTVESTRSELLRLSLHRRPSIFIPMLCLSVLICSGKLLFGQTAATGALSGLITDSSGSVVPGISVRVTSHATGQTRTATTQGNGGYLLPLLAPGEYTVETSAKGFKTVKFDDI